MELLSKKNLKTWKFFSLSILQKYEKACTEENIKDVAEQPFDKEIRYYPPI